MPETTTTEPREIARVSHERDHRGIVASARAFTSGDIEIAFTYHEERAHVVRDFEIPAGLRAKLDKAVDAARAAAAGQ